MRIIFLLSMLILLTSCDTSSSPSLSLVPLASFDSRLSETSGLIRWQAHFISHNDSGNPPELLVLDKAGQLISRLPVPAENNDWEDITARGSKVYLADTGNNGGRRRDLCILVLSLVQDKVRHQASLPVAYAEQTHFQPGRHQHNFDAEALTWVNGELWLFTKRWLDQETALYKVPTVEVSATPDSCTTHSTALRAQQQLNTKMLVTGADFDAQSNTLMLIGYSRNWLNRQAWIWLYPVQDGRVIEPLGRQFTLSDQGQFEGISLGEDGFIYVTREGRGTHLFRTDQTLSQLLINPR